MVKGEWKAILRENLAGDESDIGGKMGMNVMDFFGGVAYHEP